MDTDSAGTVIDSHLAWLKYLNRQPSSIAKRGWTLRHLEHIAGRPLLEVDAPALALFVNRPSLGTEARASAVSHVRGFFKWAVEEELLDVDPSARLRRPKRDRRLPRPMDDEHARDALNAAPDPIRQWLYLAAYAGLRACEIAQVRGQDFFLQQSPPILIIRESKGGDPSVVPIGKPLRTIAHELALHDGWCFPRGDGDPARIDYDGHVTANQVSRRANRFLHELGVIETLHQLRHWYGSQAYRATGRDLRATQELMRHKSPVSTAIYTFVDMGEAALALDALPDLGETV